jgi:hypothetical protein
MSVKLFKIKIQHCAGITPELASFTIHFSRVHFQTGYICEKLRKAVSWSRGWIQPSLRVNQIQGRAEDPFRIGE